MRAGHRVETGVILEVPVAQRLGENPPWDVRQP